MADTTKIKKISKKFHDALLDKALSGNLCDVNTWEIVSIWPEHVYEATKNRKSNRTGYMKVYKWDYKKKLVEDCEWYAKYLFLMLDYVNGNNSVDLKWMQSRCGINEKTMYRARNTFVNAWLLKKWDWWTWYANPLFTSYWWSVPEYAVSLFTEENREKFWILDYYSLE